MAYFEDGGGSPGEKGTKRALAAALTMMTANDYLIRPVLLATPVLEISFRISIDYGTLTVARLGAPRRFNSIVAIGATANFASKMLALARPGEIVLGDLARNELSLAWQMAFTELITEETGWSYRVSNRSYPLYRYTGRWSRLV